MSATQLTPLDSDGDHLLPRDELNRLNIEFESATAGEIMAWAADRFGDQLVVTSSFGDAVLAHLAWSAVPGIEVVLIDTKFLFAETLWFADHAADLFGGRVRVIEPDSAALTDNQWLDDTKGCCDTRKVAPLDDALVGNSAWVTGLRRDDSLRRATAPILSNDLLRGIVKVNPIANWTEADVDSYTIEHCLPVHPMSGRGYTSIGCWPCTVPPRNEDDARSGRFAGQGRTECGLHD